MPNASMRFRPKNETGPQNIENEVPRSIFPRRDGSVRIEHFETVYKGNQMYFVRELPCKSTNFFSRENRSGEFNFKYFLNRSSFSHAIFDPVQE